MLAALSGPLARRRSTRPSTVAWCAHVSYMPSYCVNKLALVNEMVWDVSNCSTRMIEKTPVSRPCVPVGSVTWCARSIYVIIGYNVAPTGTKRNGTKELIGTTASGLVGPPQCGAAQSETIPARCHLLSSAVIVSRYSIYLIGRKRGLGWTVSRVYSTTLPVACSPTYKLRASETHIAPRTHPV